MKVLHKGHKEVKEKEHYTPNYEFNCENTIITFDLHGVLSRPDVKKMAKIIQKHPDKRNLIKALRASGFIKELVVARLVGIDNTVPEKKMHDLTFQTEEEKDDLRYSILNPLVAQLSDAQSPDIATFEVARKIKAAGYRIYLLSNIGSEYFQLLRILWPRELFEYFDGFYTTNEDDGYIRKPNPAIFDCFHSKFNPNRELNVIFVDDGKENCEASATKGCIPIHYKDAEQLENEFVKMGIKLCPLPARSDIIA